MALIVGVTGGIGSGKTTVCNVFRILGVPVFEADAEARQLMNLSIEIRKGLKELLGNDIYSFTGQLNRQKMAKEIFNDKILLKRVNELVHPVVRREFYKFVEQYESVPYVIYEAAILFEGGFYEKMNFSILVAAPEAQRIERVMARNGLSKQSVKERLKSQWPETKKRKLADYCLENDNTHMILPEIVQMDKKLKKDGTIW